MSEVEAVNTAHSVGIKKVLLRNGQSNSDLTQVAYGSMAPGEQVGVHKHPTMEECFFFLEGKGIYEVDGESIALEKGTFVRIPANTDHAMKCTGTEKLEFFYFGVATNS